MNKISIYENEFFIVIKKNNIHIGVSKFDASIHYLKENSKETENQCNYEVKCDIIIGKISFEKSLPPRLAFVTNSTCVGNYLNEGMVYRIESIDTVRIKIGDCLKPQSNSQNSLLLSEKAMNYGILMDTIVDGDSDIEKIEKKMLSEFFWMFNRSNTFYYSEKCDIGNTIQRKHKENANINTPLFKKFDRRFFWNLYMLNDFIESYRLFQTVEIFIVPVFRGFFQSLSYCPSSKTQKLQPIQDNTPSQTNNNNNLCIMLISKQSFLRSGTRFKCRGIDTKGHVANFVETEQIVIFENSIQSFVIIRGSIPLFWQQPTTWKYKPPFVLYNKKQENREAFDLHINFLTKTYNKLCIVNLVQNKGREKVLRDNYFTYLLDSNHENIDIYDFDFHEHCKKNRFDRVNKLVDCLTNKIEEFKYFWISSDNFMLQNQEGVFRVNCVDCLDRTNVVQAAICKTVLINQLKKLGIIIEASDLGDEFTFMINNIWASNGDSISRSYAGTDALKSDYTRTGERNIGGVMLDGYKSLNRYYSNLFHDAARQVVHDIMHGKVNSASSCLSQWKISLESTLQEEKHASQAISFDIGTFFEDNHNLSNKDKNPTIVMENFVKNFCLKNPNDFVKLWTIKPFIQSYSSSRYPLIDEINLFVLCHSYIKIATFHSNGELQRHCDIPISNIDKLKLNNEGLEKNDNKVNIIFTDRNEKKMSVVFYLVDNEMDNSNKMLESFSKIFTSYVNEAGNSTFCLDYSRECDINALENFFGSLHTSNQLNIDVDFFGSFYSKIPDNGYFEFLSNNPQSLLSESHTYGSTPILFDDKLSPLTADNHKKIINKKDNDAIIFDLCDENNSFEDNLNPLPNMEFSKSSPNLEKQRSYYFTTKQKSDECSSSCININKAVNQHDFKDEFTLFCENNDPDYIESLCGKSGQNSSPKLSKSSSMSILKSKLGNVRDKTKTQLSSVGIKTKLQLVQIGNWLKGSKNNSYSSDNTESTHDTRSRNVSPALTSRNGKIKLFII